MHVTPPKDWRSRAACKNAPIEVFITVGDDEDDPFYPPDEALMFCNTCSVRTECLGYALEHGEVGVWGGTTEYQRRQLKRERERERCPGCGSLDLIYEHNIELCLSCGMSWRII